MTSASNFRKRAIRACFVCFISSTSSCVTSQGPIIVPEKRQFEVTVKADGIKQSASSGQKLIHRMQITKDELKAAVAYKLKGNSFIEGEIEQDNAGKAVGIIVRDLTRPSGFPDLGIRMGDIITSIEKQHIKSKDELWLVFDNLKNNPMTFLTLQRNGVPHKVYYYLQQ